MTMDASDLVDSRKRAALALLGLRAADQKWLLAQLPNADRGDVAALLDELMRMNPSATAAQIAAATSALNLEATQTEWAPAPGDGLPTAPEDALRTAPEDALRTAPDDALRTLTRASASLLHRELRTESDSVIGIVCALKNWRWKDELLGLLGPTRAADIGRLQREAITPTPAMAQALMAALAARIEAGRREAGFSADLRAARAQGTLGNGRWWSKWFR